MFSYMQIAGEKTHPNILKHVLPILGSYVTATITFEL
jgi:hypothetical protein